MKLKKVLAVCLATAMTFSMVACGGAGTDTTPADTSADTETEAPAEEETEAPAEEEAEAPAEDGALTYSSIKLGEDYTDITTTIKYIHCRTDREEDGTFAKLVEEFNKVYPNITVETEGIRPRCSSHRQSKCCLHRAPESHLSCISARSPVPGKLPRLCDSWFSPERNTGSLQAAG